MCTWLNLCAKASLMASDSIARRLEVSKASFFGFRKNYIGLKISVFEIYWLLDYVVLVAANSASRSAVWMSKIIFTVGHFLGLATPYLPVYAAVILMATR